MQATLFPMTPKPQPVRSASQITRKALNEAQYEAVTTVSGPVLVIAGAGSGKTRTLVYRLAHLVEQGVPVIDSKAFLHYHKRHPLRNCEDITMTTLTVTARGQVTFRKDVLQHLGIRPGEKIELDLLPDGRGVLKAARQAGAIVGFVGLLSGRTKKIATIEEINAATAQGWAGKE